jgi:hypothetical protein
MNACKHLYRKQREAVKQAGVEHVFQYSLKASAFLFVFEMIERLIGECSFYIFYEFVGFL